MHRFPRNFLLVAALAALASPGARAHVTLPPGGASPLGDSVEVHQMTMEGNVMRMRALPQGLELPPGQTVELAPGGYHLMLTGLKQPMAPGGFIPLTLRFVDRDGHEGFKEVQVPVSTAAPDGSVQGQHRH